jgi:hypothetical protein
MRSIAAALMIFSAWSSTLAAQTVEVAPFAGYNFANALFEAAAGHQLDDDGSPAVGVTLDIPLSYGMQVEGMYSHQHATAFAPAIAGPPVPTKLAIDHWLAGGLQEFGTNVSSTPFLTGMVGLTRYANGGDSEVRFTVAGGGGVKLLPTSHVGVRLDGRVLTTFLDASHRAVACVRGTCVVGLHLRTAWQAEFTAAILLRGRSASAHRAR